MEDILKCPICGQEIANNTSDNTNFCRELQENKEFLAGALNSDGLSSEARNELEKILSFMDRMDALNK